MYLFLCIMYLFFYANRVLVYAPAPTPTSKPRPHPHNPTPHPNQWTGQPVQSIPLVTSLVPSGPLGTSQIWVPLFALLAGRRRLPAVGGCNNGLMFLASPDIALHGRIWLYDLQGLRGGWPWEILKKREMVLLAHCNCL